MQLTILVLGMQRCRRGWGKRSPSCHSFLLSLSCERHTVLTLFIENPKGGWGLGNTRQRPGWGRFPPSRLQ